MGLTFAVKNFDRKSLNSSLLARGGASYTPQPKSRWPAAVSAPSQGINSRRSRQGAHSDRSCGSPNGPERGRHR